MIWNVSVSRAKYLVLALRSLDSCDDSFKNISINQLSYHQCSYSWFERVDLLLILSILWLSLGLVLSILFFICCSDILESLSFPFSNYNWRCQSFISPHKSQFVILFLEKVVGVWYILHFGEYNQLVIVLIQLTLIIGLIKIAFLFN